MGKGERELSDVVVVLVEEMGMTIHDAAKKLTEIGLIVSDLDEEELVVEGTIEAEKLSGLKRLEFVKYVRDVFNYIAEEEGEEDELGSEADDAGA